MAPALRYSLARITVFMLCLLLFWLLGLRDNPLLLLLLATTVSMFLSLFVLRAMREQFAEQVAHRVEERTERKMAKAQRRRRDEVMDDESAEDAEIAESNPPERERR